MFRKTSPPSPYQVRTNSNRMENWYGFGGARIERQKAEFECAVISAEKGRMIEEIATEV